MKKIPFKYWLVGGLLVILLGLVVYLSAQPAELTSQLTAWYKETFPRWIVNPRIFGHPTTIRHAAHMYEYFLVGAVVGVLFAKSDKRGRRMLMALLICIVISNVDQLSKPYLSGREYDTVDLIYDAMGYVTAILFVNLVHAIFFKYKKEKKEKEELLIEKKMMQQAVTGILTASLWKGDYEIPAEADWKNIYQELKTQAVASLAEPWRAQCNEISVAVSEQWRNDNKRQMAHFLRLLYAQEEVIRLLQEEGLHPVILKGCAAAIYYPQPELRTMGDIDIFVSPEEFDQSLQVMIQHGYAIPKGENFKRYHVNLFKDGMHFELHHKPAGIEENERGEYFMHFILQGFSNIKYNEVSQSMIPMFPPLQNGLVLLLHIEKHLKEGLGLRQIIDWMFFAEEYLTDAAWETEYQPVFSKGKIEELAVIVTRMCQIYLGLSEKNMTWCANADPKLCESLFAYIMEQGNFGVKERSTSHGANVLSRNGTGVNFFKTLQRNGERNWDLLKRYPKLKCFAWAYQICYYVRSAFSREHAIARTWKDFRAATKRKRLLKKLGMYQSKVDK